MKFSIKVENKFKMAQRNIYVRRKSREEILDGQRIRCPKSAYGDREEERRVVSFSLGAVDREEEVDCLEISVANQQDELGPCKIDIKSNGPVTFAPPAAASITVIPSEDLETYTSLRIPSGLPTWKLEIMRPPASESGLIPRDGSMTNVTVTEDDPGGEG